MKKMLLILGIITCLLTVGFSQISAANQERARNELGRLGLDEDAVRQRLAQRGIDIDNLDMSNPAALIEAEQTLQEVLQELEAEKVAGSIGKGAGAKISADTLKEKGKDLAKQTEEIAESVKEGSTIDEAISETIIDNENDRLPEAAIYGQELFRTQKLKLYRKSEDVKPPNYYILGPGDIVGVSIWGQSEESLVFEVKGDGYIKPPGIPRIYIKGLTFGAAKDLLRSRLSKFYKFRESEFEVTLNYARTINVSIVGEAFNYGNFNIPAINTAFNALVAGGGPSNIGSVRRIKLMRSGENERMIDVYKYLKSPEIESDYFLEENDILYIPVAEKLVTIKGAVNKPFVFELLPRENLNELIEFAGGLKANALRKKIVVQRIDGDKYKLINIDLDDFKTEDFELKDGDIVSIGLISSNYENYAVVTGAVDNPGEFSLDQATTLSTLLKEVTIREDALLELSYVTRKNDDAKTVEYIPVNLDAILKGKGKDLTLKKGDVINVFSQATYIDAKTVSIVGSVRTPRSFNYSHKNNISIAEVVFMAGGLSEDASSFAYIKRKNPDMRSESIYIKVDLDDALGSGKDKDIYKLKPDDVIQTFSKILFNDTFFVSIEGDVREPKRIKYDESLSIQDALVLSGGLKYEADRNRVDIYRVELSDKRATKVIAGSIELNEDFSIRGDVEFELQPHDIVVVRRAPEFELQRFVSIAGEVKYPGKHALTKANMRLSDLLREAGGLTKNAFIEGAKFFRTSNGLNVVIDVKNALENPDSKDNIILLQGDKLTIPKNRDLVTLNVKGTNADEFYFKDVTKSGKFEVPYVPGKSAKYYIDEYTGGFATNADRKSVSVVYPNGMLQRTKDYWICKKYPKVKRGSVISLGLKKAKKKVAKKDKKQSEVDWEKTWSKIIAQATGILTLVLLIQRI